MASPFVRNRDILPWINPWASSACFSAYSSCFNDGARVSGCLATCWPHLHRLEFGHVLPYLSDRSLQHNPCSVDVAVESPSTTPTHELPRSEGNFVESAAVEALLGGVRWLDPDHELSDFRCLVLGEPHELAPPRIQD